VAIFAFFFRQDWLAREKQIARLAREERLAELPIRLASGKTLRLGALRGWVRAHGVTGTQDVSVD
jgi:hypothetical protein